MNYFLLAETDFFRLINEAGDCNMETAYTAFATQVIELCNGGMDMNLTVIALAYIEIELQHHPVRNLSEEKREIAAYVSKALSFVRKMQKFLATPQVPPLISANNVVSICVLGIVLYFSFVKTQTEGNSNFEFNVEVPNQETDESDTNINDDSSSSHSSSQANNNHQNGRNRDHRRNQTTTHGARQTNTGSSNNTTQNQGTQTQNNSPINSGVINQLPQNNNGHNTNIEQRPSVEYTQLFNNVLNDYNKAKKAWDTIKQQKYKTRRLENMVLDFTDNINKNIAALERDKANYNALKEKNRIKDFKKLYNEIKHDWRKYDNYQPPIQGGGNEMGSQEYL